MLAPEEFWQRLDTPESVDPTPPFVDAFPAQLPDGSFLRLPLRVLPSSPTNAVASLIVNQGSFAVQDALADAVTQLVAPWRPEVVIGVPTLGLPLAHATARRLGLSRMVSLGTSRKFWYDDVLSRPLSSITTPGQGKRIFLDPRMLPLVEHRRVVVIDDVVSTGSSMRAVLPLLEDVGATLVGVGCAMLQTTAWRQGLAAWTDRVPVVAPLHTPLFERLGDGWVPLAEGPSPQE